ncbi:MAG: ATP-binding protein [Candidatus Micrarchaeota archaeon]
MYFMIEPKSKKEDFFNYEYEYNEIKKAMARKEKIISVLGVRRVGKTSLLNILYHETKGLKIWLDGRIISDPKKEVFSAIYDVAKTGKSKMFGKIESLNVSAFGIGLAIKIASEGLIEIESKIGKAGIIYVFIDEAQKTNVMDLSNVLSYCYDRFPNVFFIISGSEIGLIEDVLGEEDSKHPLYGRHITKILMNRLDKNMALDFLNSGFEQLKINIKKNEIYEAIEKLDGLIGWLTLYGYEKSIMKSEKPLEKTIEIAARIVASELTNFFKRTKNSGLYLIVLREAKGISWTELKVRTEHEFGKKLNPNSFTSAVEKLMNYSFLEKKDGKYYLADPLILKASFLVAKS